MKEIEENHKAIFFKIISNDEIRKENKTKKMSTYVNILNL